MAGSTSLVDLLALLLDIPADVPIHATPNFAPWLGSRTASWPPDHAAGGIWLIDTLDTAARRRGLLGELLAHGGFDAALVVAGARRPVLRRMIRRIRYPRCSRLPVPRVEPLLVEATRSSCVGVLGFDEDCHAPTDFLMERRASDGAAFLLTRQPPFRGRFWERLAGCLGEAELQPEWIDLRDRGAAVLAVRAGGRDCVVRVVPDAALQAVARRNHGTLEELRRGLAADDVARLLPEPLLMEMWDSTLVMVETRLPGVLAWKVASGGLADVVRLNALVFLERMRRVTERSAVLDPAELGNILAAERNRLEAVDFVPESIRTRMCAEIDGATAALHDAALRPCLSHGDFGYGNILVDPVSGALLGVIDWDTARPDDIPGVDRVNLELQLARSAEGPFASAVRSVWTDRRAHEALDGPGGSQRARALFGLAVCRYIARSFSYPLIFRQEADDFSAALVALAALE